MNERELPVTVWRITSLPRTSVRVDVQLVLATQAPLVVHAVERAARDGGLELERVNG